MPFLLIALLLQTSPPDARGIDCMSADSSRHIDSDEAAIAGWLRDHDAVPVATPDGDFLPASLPADFAWAGTVVRYTLMPTGRAGNCRVEQSSGIATLDARSCMLVLKHMIARPAMQDGRPIASEQQIGILWDRSPPPERSACVSDGGAIALRRPAAFDRAFADVGRFMTAGAVVRTRLAINSGGIPTDCQVLQTSRGTSGVVAQRTCQAALQNMRFLPAVDDHGNFVPAVSNTIVRFQSAPIKRRGKD